MPFSPNTCIVERKQLIEKYPIYVLFVDLPVNSVDFTIVPSKTTCEFTVRFLLMREGVYENDQHEFLGECFFF
jgi:hypothetical protein